jgi:16S rRNA (cytosine967-C5)-methyltransferase
MQSFFLLNMFVQAYLNTAQEIIKQYAGDEPFHSFLKKYFGLNKKFGSRDRRHIAHLCYCFFRLGKSLPKVPVEKKLPLAVFLCDKDRTALLQKLDPELNEGVDNSLDEKILHLQEVYGFRKEDIFPFKEELSEEIVNNDFSRSFLVQPQVYLRIRPGYENRSLEKLDEAEIPYQKITQHCIAVESGTKLDELLDVNKEVVIQDMNSQKVLDSLFEKSLGDRIKTAWDCCAASGGKSILLKDYFPIIELTVSDIRKSILVNLEKRFIQANIRNYQKFVVDLSENSLPVKEQFDLIICDAPCSGSGTWSRTPEQLYFFKEERIDYYASLQKKIASNAIKNLRNGGYFNYITCSVFKKENEEVVQFIQARLGLKLIGETYLKGYNDKADTLFTALFTSIS